MAAISAPRTPVIELMRNRARTLIYSTGLPPAIVAASIAALDVIEREPDYAALPVQKARAFTRSRRPARGAKPDRAGGDRRGRCGARGLAAAGGRRLPRRRDPPADGAGRHRAAALTFTAQHPDDDDRAARRHRAREDIGA